MAKTAFAECSSKLCLCNNNPTKYNQQPLMREHCLQSTFSPVSHFILAMTPWGIAGQTPPDTTQLF